MINKKQLLSLKKEIAINAFRRWKDRKSARQQVADPNSPGLARYNSDERIKNYLQRESRRSSRVAPPAKRIILNERIIRTNDLADIAPNQNALEAGVAVARIQTIPGNGYMPDGFATGFLVAPNLLLTNHHVFPDRESARDCAANFLYERTRSGIQEGYPFALDPDTFFLADYDLDYALVYVSSQSLNGNVTLRNFPPLCLIETKGKILTGQPVSIIQHPGGGPKQYAYSDNLVLDILEEQGFIQYSTDTLPGSSGSPCFNSFWEVAALHHSGVPFMVDGKIMTVNGVPWDEEYMSDDDIQWIANEGISVSTIVAHLKKQQPATLDQQKLLQALIASTTDPLARPESVKPAPDATGVPTIPNAPRIPSPSTSIPMSEMTFNFNGNTTVYINSTGVQDVITNGKEQKFSQDGRQLFTEKKQTFDEDYDSRDQKGYRPDFLNGFQIALPRVLSKRKNELFLRFDNDQPYVLNYYHFSLVMNKKRRFMMWSASNINYNPGKKSDKSRKEFGGEDWRLDPRIPAKFQVQDHELYKPATNIDRGHIVRREDNCWGNSEKEIAYANADTYHWTNCTPQHERFNQYREGGHQGLWGRLETVIEQQLDVIDRKAIVFAGPVLSKDDEAVDYGAGEILSPDQYWKIIVVRESSGELCAYGFLLDQTNVVKRFGRFEEAELDFSQFKAQQVTIQRITELTDVVFDAQVYEADVLTGHDSLINEGLPFKSEKDLFLKKKVLPGSRAGLDAATV